MSQSMIERVAKAIENCKDSAGQLDYISQAKAAIEALKPPTKEMIQGALGKDCPDWLCQDMSIIFQQMIDVALQK